MSQTNIEFVKTCYAAFQRGDIATILSLVADDVDWTNPGEGVPTCGTRRSVAEVGRFFEIVDSTWNFTAFEPREYVASGDTVVAIGSYAAIAKQTGKSVASEWVMVWKIRDGKVTYFREYTDTEALAGAAKKAAAA
jgi:ketosteroid isomerase-like protein